MDTKWKRNGNARSSRRLGSHLNSPNLFSSHRLVLQVLHCSCRQAGVVRFGLVRRVSAGLGGLDDPVSHHSGHSAVSGHPNVDLPSTHLFMVESRFSTHRVARLRKGVPATGRTQRGRVLNKCSPGLATSGVVRGQLGDPLAQHTKEWWSCRPWVRWRRSQPSGQAGRGGPAANCD